MGRTEGSVRLEGKPDNDVEKGLPRFILTDKVMGVSLKIRRGVEQSGSSSGS